MVRQAARQGLSRSPSRGWSLPDLGKDRVVDIGKGLAHREPDSRLMCIASGSCNALVLSHRKPRKRDPVSISTRRTFALGQLKIRQSRATCHYERVHRFFRARRSHKAEQAVYKTIDRAAFWMRKAAPIGKSAEHPRAAANLLFHARHISARIAGPILIGWAHVLCQALQDRIWPGAGGADAGRTARGVRALACPRCSRRKFIPC